MNSKLFITLAIFAYIFTACEKEYEPASIDKIRLAWNDNPETTITIGWDQLGAENPQVYYGTKDKDRRWKRYKLSQMPTREVN